jgi:DNA polymerase III epsilon subunit-like protein
MEKSRKLLFLDTETTGNTEADFLCQVAYQVNDEEIKEELFKPEIPISVESSSVCHITNRMVADKSPFRGSHFSEKLTTDLTESVFVAHNAIFDITMLKKEDIEIDDYICTMKIEKYLDKDGTIPRYSLQYLRYFYDFDVEAFAHQASDDIKVLKVLFKHQLDRLMKEESLSEEDAVLKMITISKAPSIIKIIPFGKHKGKNIEDVAKEDKGYLEWLLNEKLKNPQIGDEDWVHTLKSFLGK